jgi:hypothetical protein
MQERIFLKSIISWKLGRMLNFQISMIDVTEISIKIHP